MKLAGSALTFKNGSFVLNSGSAKITTPGWERRDSSSFVTNSLRAAAAFKSNADEIAKKVFKRNFNLLYETPALPSLDFLDAHQIEGVKWVLSRKRSYLAHAPGAGKTAEAIVAAQLNPGCGVTVFIVPPGLEANWEREIFKFCLSDWPRIGIVKETSEQYGVDWAADYIIVPDSMLAKDWVYTELRDLPIKFLGIDEASRFKEPTALRTIALFGGQNGENKFPGLYHRVRHVVLLDGSPMPNRPMELWAPTFSLDPEAIDCLDQNSFGYRYCGATLNARGVWEFRHSSNEAELKTKLQKRFMHVVTEDQLEHPERRRSIVFMNEDVRTPDHRSWERKHLHSINLADIDENISKGDIARYRRELGIRKIPWIKKYVSSRLANKNESILLFAWHREVCTELARALEKYNPGLVIGGVDGFEREKIFRQFQAGERKIIIGNILAMGRGHNLQRADRVIFGEFSWTDETNKQAEKRASRRGRDQSQIVRCEYIVSPNSMDEVVLNSVFSKVDRTRRIVG